ncbi:yeats family-domain-containing protein, partial [Entophlyctis helioformis]
MTATKRVKGALFSIPFVYGSIATPITKRDTVADPSHTHRWTVYVRGLDNKDMSFCFKRVTIKLHESFPTPSRVLETPPYEVTETGWGEFEIMIKISFLDPAEKPVTVYHQLQLYPKDETALLPSKKPVIVEHYDEIIFSEPTEEMIEGLRAYSEALVVPESGQFSLQAEEAEIAKMDEVQAKVLEEQDRYRLLVTKAEEELRAIQAESRELEAMQGQA